MTYFIYTFTGAICHYFFCIYLLPDKLTFIKQLVVFSYTFIIFFSFWPNLWTGQYIYHLWGKHTLDIFFYR